MKIKNKTVWITGASSGIGKALSEILFEHGATVIISSNEAEKLYEQKKQFDSMEKGRCHVIPFDMTQSDEIEQAVAAAIKLIPHIDILVNNAGISQRSYALDTLLSVDRKIFEINYFGAITLTKLLLPRMIENGGGHIVVMSSMAGKYGFRMRTAYSAAKHALHGFFESLRAELHDQNIKVTMICPGRINTEISVHSLVGDGRQHGLMDKAQQQGIAVEKCARIIHRAIEHNRKEVFIGRGEVLLLVLKRLCPPLYYWIVNRASPT